ncbi:MAG: vitamin B12 dependent-methionine synthase activation domain-containing protein [Prolixibacteraceae bacterium]
MTQNIHPEIMEVTFSASSMNVKVENVLSNLGMKLSDADDYILSLIDQFTIECKQLAQPRASFLFLSEPHFDTIEKNLHIKHQIFHLGKTITSMLKKSEQVVIFAATVGDAIEQYSKKQMKEGNSLEGYLIDIMGSELAENTADHLHNYLEDLVAKNGLGLSNRYSPGYCNWPVSDQKSLFELLGQTPCGISLNASSLMSPVKSVSGILGLGKGLKRVDYKCRLCTDEKCILRRQF